MDLELNNVSTKDEGFKINDFKNFDYNIIPFNFNNEKNFLTIANIFSICT